MDKSCHSLGDSTITTTTAGSSHNINSNNRDQYLKHLNKISHKISKPQHNVITTAHFRKQPSTFDDHRRPNHEPPAQQVQAQPQPQNQPPVYNINKNDFRDVVQRLTGSPAHERFSTPPSINPPKPQSSRLQRIRPPPLAQISNRPPTLLNSAAPPPFSPINPVRATTSPSFAAGAVTANFATSQRQAHPLSPLPPFPSVHATAESPISAYMRFLQSSTSSIDSDQKRFSGLSPLAPPVSPQWNNLAQLQQPLLPPPPQPLPPHQQPNMRPNTSSPLPFGCLPSPRSPYPSLSPTLLFSPTGRLGFQQYPLSPTLPVPSPMWKGL